MHLSDLKSWHWLIIALLIGIAGGELRVFSLGTVDPANIPADLSYQQLRFEEALLGDFKGQPLLSDIEISPRRIADRKGGSRLFDVVFARYSNGVVEDHDGQKQVFWRPSVFLMPVPYKPQIDLSRLNRTGRPNAVTAWATVSNPTVVDFLRFVGKSRDVTYSYAWWDLYPRLTVIGASVMLIGILLPALINVLTFGSLRRPPEEPAIKLKASPSRDVQGAEAQLPEQQEDERLVDKQTKDSVSTASAAPQTAVTAIAQPPKKLQQESATATAAVASQPKDFAAKKDDYYPTERRVGKAKSELNSG